MSGTQPPPGPHRFARALAALEEELNWKHLGELQCSEGGADFFGAEQVEALWEAGLIIANELGEQLGQLPPGPGRSLYVGAAVAELVPALVEQLVLGREVVLFNLDNEETAELNRGLQAAERCGLDLPRIHTREFTTADGSFDHAWIVSVLNDPDAFPALHDELYGRRGELATGRGVLSEDLERANGLVDAILERLTTEALLTTTDEELPVWRPRLAHARRSMRVGEKALLTGVVGDPLRFLRLTGID